MIKNLNRFHLLLSNLDIWVYPDEKKITIYKSDQIPYGSMVVVPDDAKLFEGTYDELETLLEKLKDKIPMEKK